jgi:FAS-associated factor 2
MAHFVDPYDDFGMAAAAAAGDTRAVDAEEVCRQQILEEFQEFTGIQNIEEAIRMLDECGWMLNISETRRAAAAVPATNTSKAIKDAPADPKPSSSTQRKEKEAPAPSSDESDDEIDFNFDDDATIDLTNTPDFKSDGPKQPKNMIPDTVESEEAGAILFGTNFAGRYGNLHPQFFMGTLDNAIKEASNGPARNKRMLAVYIHDDDSILANVFCSQVLCAETTVNYLTDNFVVWGWDSTTPAATQLLHTAIVKSFGGAQGRRGLNLIRSISPERFPILVLAFRRGSVLEITNTIFGDETLDNVMAKLASAHGVYRAQLATEIREEEEREARQLVLQEQDAAYQESLRADRAKEEAKVQAEAEAKLRAAKAVTDAQDRNKVKKQLPPEPDATETKEPICTLKIRVPERKPMLVRRFFQSSPVKLLLDYLYSEGYSKNEYRFLFSYPKRNLAESYPDAGTRLGSIFSAQDTLIVEQI